MYKIAEPLIKKGTSLALIPARSGSKGVPKKNIKPLKGFPLIAYSIAAVTLAKQVQRVIVSTDSEEIAEIARRFGAEVPFLRPAELAGDSSGDIEFVQHTLSWLQFHEGCLPEFIVHIRPTTPLREPCILDQALALIKDNEQATSLRSGHKASESPFKWFIKNERGYFESIKKGISNEEANGGRQTFPSVYIPDGYVDVIRTAFVSKSGILHGRNMLGFESPSCYEVDTQEDMFLLRYQIETYGSPLHEYLLKNYYELQMN